MAIKNNIDITGNKKLRGAEIEQLVIFYNILVEEKIRRGQHDLILFLLDESYYEVAKLWTFGIGATVPLIARYVAEQQLLRTQGKSDYSKALNKYINELFPGAF